MRGSSISVAFEKRIVSWLMQMKRKEIDVNVLRPALGMKKLLKIMVEVEAHVTKRY